MSLNTSRLYEAAGHAEATAETIAGLDAWRSMDPLQQPTYQDA